MSDKWGLTPEYLSWSYWHDLERRIKDKYGDEGFELLREYVQAMIDKDSRTSDD